MTKYRASTPNVVESQRDLERRVSRQERLPRLPNATVDPGQTLSIMGSFRVFDSSGRLLMESGDGAGSGSDGTWVVYHPDGDPNPNPVADPYAGAGSPALRIAHGSGNDPTNVNDMSTWIIARSGNPILAEAGNGNGLGLPYKSFYACPTSEFTTPVVTTTSATFVSQWVIHGRYHSPKIEVVVRVLCSDGSTGGNIRIKDGFSTGGFLGPTQAIALGANAYITMLGDFAQPAGYAPFFKFEVEVQRTAGTGTIGTQLVSAEGYGDI